MAESFAANGWNVLVLDNLSRGVTFSRGSSDSAHYNWRHLAAVPRVRRIRGSVTNVPLVRKLIRSADAVVHLAAQVAVTTSLEDPENDFRTNAVGTFNVLEASRLSPRSPSIVFASTNKVYGANVNRIPVRVRAGRYVVTRTLPILTAFRKASPRI